MRTIISFLLSVLAGALVVQQLAVWSRGQEEFIPLFVLPALVAVVVSVLFLIARFRPDPVKAAGRIAKTLIVLLVLGFVFLASLILIDSGPETLMRDGVIIVAIALPQIVVVAVQWLLFGRGQAASPAIRFGRGSA